MFKVLKNLKESWISVITIVLLLIVQAAGDLTLPDYTSKIVNVGIQNGGIENVAPEVIRKSEMDNMLIFTDEDDKILASYEEISIPATSIPQILYACYKIVKNKQSFSALTDKITEFVNTYDDNEEYKLFVQSGTTSQENVDGRFQYWRGVVKELQ